MTRSSQPPRPRSPFFSAAHPSRRQLLLGAASLGAASFLAACGGGGSDDPAAGASAAAEGFTSGPISGFGSVIVAGIRFDDTLAIIVDEDGNLRTRGDLKLGALIDVDSRRVDRAEMRAVALRIALGGALVGPVGAVDSAASTFTLLGQTVLVTTSTVFDSSVAGGIGGITAGQVYEVYGLFDPANRRFVATRIEAKPGATEYRLRGLIAELNTTAKTFKIGNELINYAGVPNADVPRTLANGQLVRVRLQTAQVGGAWVATRLRHSVRTLEPRTEARVEGVITSFTSITSFAIDGVTVDASGATFPEGTAGIVLGARVEADGALVNGVLVATKVEIQDLRDLGRRLLEFRGEMSNLDTAAKTFALRGLTIWYGGGSLTYRNGNELSLTNGRLVEVKGVIAPDRTRVEALRIEFR